MRRERNSAAAPRGVFTNDEHPSGLGIDGLVSSSSRRVFELRPNGLLPRETLLVVHHARILQVEFWVGASGAVTLTKHIGVPAAGISDSCQVSGLDRSPHVLNYLSGVL